MNEHIYEELPDHHFRTEIPNVVFSLRLHPYALAIYAYLKRVAGDSGYCSKHKKRIAEELSMSESSYTKYRKELTNPFEELNGKPLISVQERKKECGSHDSTIITIIPIWRENGDFFRNQKKSTRFSDGRGVGRHTAEVGRHTATEEEPSKKNLLKKDQVNKETRSFFSKREDMEASPVQEVEKNFINSLDDEQKCLHDEIVSYQPITGKAFPSSDLCAWFKARGYTADQVSTAFEVYKQDEADYFKKQMDYDSGVISKKPTELRCMQAIMCKAIQTSRKPINCDIEQNKGLAERISNIYGNGFFETTKRYVKIRLGNLREELHYSLPKQTFAELLKKYVLTLPKENSHVPQM